MRAAGNEHERRTETDGREFHAQRLLRFKVPALSIAGWITAARAVAMSPPPDALLTPEMIAAGTLGPQEEVPGWVIVSCYFAIALGTFFGGWRIVKTMGQKITKLKPVHGFCAETGGAIMLFTATGLGIPVSTTHTITGAIVGVGSTRKVSAVRWGVAGNIVWAWIFTIPASAFIAAIFFWVGTQVL